MENLEKLKLLQDTATDSADLGETIGFMHLVQPLQRGFQVSDHDHAQMITNWLCELSQYRRLNSSLADEIETLRKFADQFVGQCKREMLRSQRLKERASMQYHQGEINYQEGRWCCDHDLHKFTTKALGVKDGNF